MTRVCLDFDDFSSCNHNMPVLRKLKEYFPNFKVSVFAAPFDTQFGSEPMSWIKNKKWLEAIKTCDWIEILPHGLIHKHLEWYTLNYNQASTVLDAIEAALKENGIENKKIFKAPYWEMSYDAAKLLTDRGYTICNYPNQKLPKDLNMKQYEYNWNVKDPIPENLDLIKGHGHIQNTQGNGLSECLENIMKLPQDTEFKFISEVI